MHHDFNSIHLLRAIRLIPSSEIDSLEKLILYTLLSCSNTENDSWHSQETLAELTSSCSRTIRRKTKLLVQKKYILVKSPTTYHRGASNHYSLNVDHIMFYFSPNKGDTESTFNQRRRTYSPVKGDSVSGERRTHSPTKIQREDTKEDACARDPFKGSPLRSTYGDDKPCPMPDHIREALNKLWSKNRQDTH